MSREYLEDFVSTQHAGTRKNSGIGYITIKCKDNQPREKYIQDCNLRGCVNIILEDGGFIENVPVLKHVWNDIEFPENDTQLGSQVFWENISKSSLVLIIGILPKNNELINVQEHQFILAKSFNNNYLEISGDAKSGNMNITIDGGKDSGELNLNVFNKNKNATLNLNVKGNMNVDSSDTININSSNKIKFSVNNSKTMFYYEKEKGFFYTDEFNNSYTIDKNNIQFKAAKKINLGTGKEGISLGQQTEDMFNEILTEIGKTTTTTALGVMPILNAVQILALKITTKKIISKYSFTD